MMISVRMDAEIGFEDSLPLSTTHPFGYGVVYLKSRKKYVLVSRSTGVLQYFKDDQELELWGLWAIRIRVREAWMGKRNLDFRVYRWDEAQKGWVIHMTSIELDDTRSVLRSAIAAALEEQAQEVHA